MAKPGGFRLSVLSFKSKEVRDPSIKSTKQAKDAISSRSTANIELNDEEIEEAIRFFLEGNGFMGIKKLSQGRFGIVYKGQYDLSSFVANQGDLKKLSNKPGDGPVIADVAIKCVNLERCDDLVRDKFLPREIEAMTKFKHPNAIRLLSTIIEEGWLFFVLEFAPRGTLQDYLVAYGSGLPEKLAGFWYNQMMNAIYSLHKDYQTAHRDIKLENVILSANNDAKLSDFGFAKVVLANSNNPNQTLLSTTFCGTLPYFAPEILKQIPYDPYAADMWATGVALYALLTRKYAFRVGGPEVMISEQIKRAYRNQPNWETFSPQCKSLIDGILNPVFKDRLTREQMKDHEWAKANNERPPLIDPPPKEKVSQSDILNDAKKMTLAPKKA